MHVSASRFRNVLRAFELGAVAPSGQTRDCDAAPSHFHTRLVDPFPADPTRACISRGFDPGVLMRHYGEGTTLR